MAIYTVRGFGTELSSNLLLPTILYGRVGESHSHTFIVIVLSEHTQGVPKSWFTFMSLRVGL